MTELFLISGFLGAGKTTAVNRLLKCFHDKSVGVIVNEYGRVGVDGSLVSGNIVSEITNGSIFCSCRSDQFEQALTQMLAKMCDVIVVEASGLSNPDAIDKVLARRSDRDTFTYRGNICLIDAPRLHKVLYTTVVVPKQIAAADLLIINKVDLVSNEEVLALQAELLQRRPDARQLLTTYVQFDCRDVCDRLTRVNDATKDGEIHTQDLTLRKAIVTFSDQLTLMDLEIFLSELSPKSWRIKGYVDVEHHLLFVDAVGDHVTISEYGTAAQCIPPQGLVVLWGKGEQAGRVLRTVIEEIPAVKEVSYGS